MNTIQSFMHQENFISEKQVSIKQKFKQFRICDIIYDWIFCLLMNFMCNCFMLLQFLAINRQLEITHSEKCRISRMGTVFKIPRFLYRH